MPESVTYPFSAIVSLEDLRLALILNAINPKIGGLLVRGQKGSGKTTAVRALADILPNIKVIKDSPFNCNPEDVSNMCDKCRSLYRNNEALPFEERKMKVVDLPLGATEDRVVGSLDVEKAIKMGVEALEPGILAEANQNILYVDEVNLLPDHIADDLLDAAATGWNMVEREGISVKHPSRFIFIGTMNPEEGQLRPQLLDRFPLSAEAIRISDVKDRIEIVKRNIEFEADPEAFLKKRSPEQEELKKKIIQARKILPQVQMPEALIAIISMICLELKVDGVRPDIVITKTAQTLAAFENQTNVTTAHVMKAAELTLSHRTREGGFLEPATPQEIRETLAAKLKEANYPPSTEKSVKGAKGGSEEKKSGFPEEKRKLFPPIGLRKIGDNEKVLGKAQEPEGHVSQPRLIRDTDLATGQFVFDSQPKSGGKAASFPKETKWSTLRWSKGKAFLDKIRQSDMLPFKLFFRMRKVSAHVAEEVGKRAEAITKVHRGRAREWRTPDGKPSDIHFPATIRAAARMQRFRKKRPEVALEIRSEDVREKLRVYRAPITVVFVLDLSESMIQSLDEVKQAMLKLHSDAYRYRDKVGVVVFKEMGAAVIQHPTSNLRLVANKLLQLKMSGLTPLPAGMLKALEVLKEAKKRDVSTVPAIVIITDGDANVPLRRDVFTGEVRMFDELGVAFFEREEEVMKDIISVSKMIRKEGFFTVVINILPSLTDLPTSSGFITTKMIASITNGLYYEFSMSRVDQQQRLNRDILNAVRQAQRELSQTHSERVLLSQSEGAWNVSSWER